MYYKEFKIEILHISGENENGPIRIAHAFISGFALPEALPKALKHGLQLQIPSSIDNFDDAIERIKSFIDEGKIKIKDKKVFIDPKDQLAFETL